MAENTNINTPLNDGLSLSSPVSYSSQEHQDITDSLREATVSYDPDSKIDMESIKFIDNQAAAINESSPVNPVRFTSPYPGNVSQNRNPFSNQTGQFDLTTTQGRRDYLGTVGRQIQNKANNVPHGGTWKNPIIFGKKQMNADRYMNHKKFKDLGFHPFVDNETYYNQNSTAWDDLSRTSTAFVQMFKPAFTSGWRALRDTLHGDPFKMDYQGAEAMQDAMRIASSTRGGVTGFANDLYLNSAYTFGIVGSMFVEEAALAFMGGYALPHLAATRTAGRFKHLFQGIDAIKGATSTVGNYSMDLMRSMGAVDKAKDFYNYSKGTWGGKSADWMVRQLMPETTRALQTINSTKNTANNLSNLAKGAKTFGSFYRDIRMFNVAWSESRLEGGLREIESAEQEYMRAIKRNDGKPLTDEQWDILRNASKSAGLKTALMNFPIIYLSNKFVLDTALRGFKPLGRLLQESKASLGRKIMRTAKAGVAKEGQKAFQVLGTGVKRGYKEILQGGLLGLGAFSVKYLQANLAEGFQELAQESVSAGVGIYYETLLDDVLADSMNMNSAELDERVKNADASWLKSLKAGTQSEAVSFKTFMSGFLMGGIVQPFQTIMFQKMPNLYKRYTDREAFDAYALAKKKYLERVVNNLDESWNDPLNFLDINKLDALNQREFNRQAEIHSYYDNVLGFKDAKDQAIFSHIYTMIRHNKAGDFKAHIEAFVNMSDTDLVNAFENSDATAAEIRKRFKGIVNKIDQIQENYNNFNDKYINPFNPDNFEKGTRLHAQERIRQLAFEHAKMMFLFTKNTYERGVERMDSIVENIKSDPVVDTIAANDISALLDIQTDAGSIGSLFGLDAELQILKDETKITPAKNASKDLKQQHKNKLEKIKILEEYRKQITDKNNYMSSGTEMVDEIQEDGTVKQVEQKKIAPGAKMTKSGKAKLKKAFIDYLNLIANTTGGRIQDNDGINKAFEMIIDYKALNGRTNDYYKASQILDNPDILNSIADRTSAAMNKIWKHYKKKNIQHQKLTKFMDKQERGKIISDLARKGIYTDVEQAEKFIATGERPDAWYSDEDRLTELSLIENPQAYNTVLQVINNYEKQKEADSIARKEVGEELEATEEELETGGLDANDTITEDTVLPVTGDTQEDGTKKGTELPTNRQATSKDFENFIASDASTLEILKKRFAEYEYEVNTLNKRDLVDENNQSLNFSAWIKHEEGGRKYVRARYKLFYGYSMKSLGAKQKQTFDEYLTANQNAPFFKNTARLFKVKPHDLLIESTVDGNTKLEDGLSNTDTVKEEIVDTGDDFYNTGIKIIKKTTYNKNTNEEKIHYLILTMNNVNTFDQYKGLTGAGEKLQPYYTNSDPKKALNEAYTAANWLKYNVPKQDVFEYEVRTGEKESFTTGEVVIDNEGNRYSVESTKSNVDNHKNLWVKNLKTKEDVFIEKGKFYEKGGSKKGPWQRSSDEKIKLGIAEKVTTLPINEPLQIFPYDTKKAPGKTDTRDPLTKQIEKEYLEEQSSKILQGLDSKAKDNLEVRIVKGEDFDKVMGIEPHKRDNYSAIGRNPENKYLKKGAAKHYVVIYHKGTPLFVVHNMHTTTLLDPFNSKKEINPILITQKQAEKLFRLKNGKHLSGNKQAYKTIRRNYAAAQAMEEVFEELLEKSETGMVSITLKELRENHQIHFKVDGGTFAYQNEEVVMEKDEYGRETGIAKLDKNKQPVKRKVRARSSLKELIFDLGEGDREYKDTDGTIKKEPYYIIFDQSTMPPAVITNMSRTGKQGVAFDIAYKKILQSMRQQNFDVSTLGRYAYFVFSPGIGQNGQYTAIQLKPKTKSFEEVKTILHNLKDRAKKTYEENTVIDEKTKKRKFKSGIYTKRENEALNDSLFITGSEGSQIFLDVTDYGKVKVRYKNTIYDFDIEQKYTATYIDTILQGENGVVELLKEFNKDINAQLKALDVKHKKREDGSKIPYQLNLRTGEKGSFRNSIPKQISGQQNSFDWINDNVDAIMAPSIRNNVRGSMVSTDSERIDIILNSALDAKESQKESEEVKETTNVKKTEAKQSLDNDAVWMPLFTRDGLENTPKSILFDIATELAEFGEIAGESPLAKRKRLVLENPEAYAMIQKMLDEIKTASAKPEVIKKIDPSDNQYELGEIDKLETELERLKQQKTKEIFELRSKEILEDGSDNPRYVKDVSRRRGLTLHDVKQDEEIQDLQRRIDEIQGDAYKIVDENFDGRDVEDINVFKEWMKNNLPDYITIKDIDELTSRLKNKGTTVGAFIMNLKTIAGKKNFVGQIYTNASNSFRYHEAFHATFRMLLTDAEIKKYLAIGKKGKLAELKKQKISLKQALKDLRLMSPTYSKMSEKQLEELLWEEWLADQFESFKTSPKEVKVDSETKSLFQKIMDWIMSIFERMSPLESQTQLSNLDPDLHRLFDNINSGHFKSANVQNNRFTDAVAESSGGVSNPAWAIVKEIKTIPYTVESITSPGEFVTKYRNIVIPFPQKELDRIVKQTANVYQKLKKRAIEKGESISKRQLVEKAIDMMTDMYNPQRKFYDSYDITTPEGYTAINEIEKKYNALVKNKREFYAGVANFISLLESIDDSLISDDYTLNNEDSESTYDANEKRNQQGSLKNVNEQIRTFFLAATVEVDDPLGNIYVNPDAPIDERIKLEETVDYIKVFNGFLKGLADQKDPMIAIEKLYLFSEDNPQTRAVVELLFERLFGTGGFNKVADFVLNENTPMPEVLKGQEEFFQQLMKAFYQFKQEYIQVLRDVNSKAVSLIPADKQNDENWQTTEWFGSYNDKKIKIANDINKGENSKIAKELLRLSNIIEQRAISDSDLSSESKYYSEFIRDRLGISLSPQFIAYSIAVGKIEKTEKQRKLVKLYPEVRGIQINDPEDGWNDLKQLVKSLQNGEDLFNEVIREEDSEVSGETRADNVASKKSNKNDGVFYRLQKWAIANAEFDETIGSTVLYDEKGNYIYIFQTPTLHLEVAQDMNTEEGLKKVIKEKEVDNGLVDEETPEGKKTMTLARKKRLKIKRVKGLRNTSLIKNKEGDLVENKSLDVNKLPGSSFGDLTFNEFIATAINMYGLNFNGITGKVEQEKYWDDELQDWIPFTYNPILIRVLSESNIADYQNVPIMQVLKTQKKDGEFQFTEEYKDRWKRKIKRKYNEIKYHYERLVSGERDKDDIDQNFNSIYDKAGFDITSVEKLEETDTDPTVGRAYKFNFDLDGLLSIQNLVAQVLELNADEVVGKRGKLTDAEAINLVEGDQSIFLKNKRIGKLNDTNRRGIVIIDDVQYLVKYEGSVNRTQIDQNIIAEGLGKNQIQEEKDEKRGFIHKMHLNGVTYYAKVGEIAKFFGGTQNKIVPKPKHMYTIKPLEQVKREDTTQEDDALFDNQLKIYLEKKAREGVSFEEAMDSYLDKKQRTADDFIVEALNNQYSRFDIEMSESGAIKQVNSRLLDGFGSSMYGVDSTVMKRAQDARALMHLEKDDQDHNMRQIFFSNWINTTDLNEIYGGNQARSLKDAVDAGKRAKDRNAGGKSASSIIGLEEMGIKPTQEFGIITFSDIPGVQKYGKKGISKTGANRTDGQVYTTINAFKHFWFGLGELNPAQKKVIRKIEAGEPITEEEFFGSVEEGSEGWKQNKGYINSKKFVYADGQTYLKMSVVVLRKSLDSNADGSIAEGMEELYHLRVALEDYEKRTGKLMMGVPVSASKMRKRNVLDPDMTSKLFNGQLIIGEEVEGVGFTKDGEITHNSVQTLDANQLRLQQITPSNKIEIVEPRQIKNLIESEQNDSEIVILGGKEITIGEIRALYRHSINNRMQLNYYGRNSLIFDLPHAFEAIDQAVNKEKLTPDLEAFLDYALHALETSQGSPQLLEFFTKLKNGESKYELNNPITIQKFTELMMSFFQKGVIGQRQPGKALTLMSDFGVRVIKRVDAVDENGTPIAWTVIRREDWRNRTSDERGSVNNGRGILKPEDNDQGIIVGLEVGQIYTDRLRHDVTDYKRNEKGELVRENGKLVDLGNTYTEFITAPHFAEEMKLKDGESIPDVLSRQFAVRIPSQDKHSAVNLKLVDYLPVDMGSTGVFAYELLEISGADYDIDKVYVQHKEFFERDGKLIEYGKAEKLEDQYEEYMLHSEKEMEKRGTNLYYARKKYFGRRDKSEPLVDKTAEDVEEEFVQWVIANRNFMQEDEKLMKLKFVEEKNEKIKDENKHYKYDYKANEFEPIYKTLDKRDIVLGALKILNLPTSKKEYADYREKNKTVVKLKNGQELTIYGEPYAAAYSNNILDYKILLLGNNSMSRPRKGRTNAIKNEPAVNNIFEEIWEKWETDAPKIYQRNRVDLGYDPNNLLGQFKLFRDSKEGSRNIGQVVPVNTVISWHRVNKTKLRTLDSKKDPIELPRLNLHTYDNYDIEYFIDPQTGKQIKGKYGIRLQDALSQVISIMVDNPTNPYSAKFGLNKHASSILSNGIGLGIDVETLLLLINHPIIVDSYHTGLNKNKPSDPGPMKILQKYISKFQKSKDTTQKDMWEDSLETEVTKEMLLEHANIIKDLQQEVLDGKRKKLPEKVQIEILAIIQQMLNLNNIKKYNDDLVGVSQIEKGGMRDFEDIMGIQTSIEDLGLNLTEEEYNKSDRLFSYDFIKKIRDENSIVGANLKIFKHLREKALPHVVLTMSEPFNKLFNLLTAALPRMSMDQLKIAHGKIRRDLLSYLTIKAYMHRMSNIPSDWANKKIKSLNNALIYDQMGDANSIRIDKVVADVRKYLEETGKTNIFIQEFIKGQNAAAKNNDKLINTLDTRNFVKLTAKREEELQGAFLELLLNERTKEAAFHIIHYLMVTGGLQNRFGSFTKVVPPVLLSEYLNSSTEVKELFARTKHQTKEERNREFQTVFGMRFEDMAKDVTRWFESSVDVHYTTTIKQKGASVLNSPEVEHDIETIALDWARIVNKNKIVSNNQKTLYIISDTIKQDGYGSELEFLRNYDNVFSIPVKHKSEGGFYTDQDYDEAVNAIDKAIAEIELALPVYDKITFPKDGIGTSLRYKLKNAPRILEYLNDQLLRKFGYNNASQKLEPVKGQSAKIELDTESIKKIEEGKKTTIIKTPTQSSNVNIKEGETKYVKFGKTWYKVKNLGLKNIEEAGGQDTMLESDGYEALSEVYKDHINFFEGTEEAYVYEIQETDKEPKQEMVSKVASVLSSGRITSPIVIRDDSVDINVGYNTGKKWGRVKGKRKRVNLTQWEKDGKLFQNAERIRKAGFKTEILETGQEVIIFPPVIRVKTDTGSTYYKLVDIRAPWAKGSGDVSNDIYDIDSGKNALRGVGATYEKFVPVGSKYQWKMGFILDVNKEEGTGKTETQPPFPELVADIKSKKKNVTTSNLPTTDTNTEFNLPPGTLPKKARTRTSNTKFDSVEVNSDGVDFIKDGEVSDTTKEGGNSEEIKMNNTTYEKPPEGRGVSKNLFSKVENNSARITKDDMKGDNDSKIDYLPLRQWYYKKSDLELQKIAENLALSNWMLKDFIADFENTNERNNLAEYIERLNQCY